ncbi:MFS general substrate transporter [Aaosphaeria arxii CBS 175.79]|uniref:MFS general substrate transporter n=1 Tax=Aaosphaeria arxii CBS 175.79 TaxID=1450172 RepID=A0A6A5Y4R2_9PLEO|nr:MFS general substrate transporter [Aaosphaeria arxii CBS 175.79]KAF2020249.1 MFS general substrate transporter [Aaosphaeria arxii CBS 175.79]
MEEGKQMRSSSNAITEATPRRSYLSTTPSSPNSASVDSITTTTSPEKAKVAQLRPSSFPDSSISESLSASTTNDQLKSNDRREPAQPSDDSFASTPTGEHASTRPSLSVLFCFAALTLSIFLVALDSVIIPTALPTISASFSIPDSLYAWIGSSYLLTNAASIPFWAKLSDIFGRKPIILIANAIFLVGSIVCAVSINATMLVAGRSVQGLGGGGVVVLVHVCVADMFSIRIRSFYLGIVGAAWAVASALGPVLGGVFAEKLDWRWCFYVNLPIVSGAIIILYFTLHLQESSTPLIAGLLSMDWAGCVAIVTATIFFLVGLQLGGESTYAKPLVICLIVFGCLAYVAFPFTQYFTEKRSGSPIMPLRIFKDVSNLSALAVCACDALVFNSVAYFLPLYFQIVLNESPSTTGLLMLAVAIPLALVSFISGIIMGKTNRYLEVLQGGLAIMTLGVGLLISLSIKRDLGKIIGFLVVIGIGFGPNFQAPILALQARIQGKDMASGVAAFNFVRMVSGAIGVVVGQVVFQLLIKPHYGDFLVSGVSAEFASRLAGGKAINEAGAVATLPDYQRDVVRKAMLSALRGSWIFYTAVSGAGLLVSFGIARQRLSEETENKSSEGEKA